ncbi:MAG TPA: hypothetical protein VIY73_27895 [Polyangiaceae bacterium]
MPRSTTVLAASLVALASACAAQPRVPPASLVDARADFAHARSGAAATLDPGDLQAAEGALRHAEAAFRDHPAAPSTAELALVADRAALYAQSQAAILQADEEARRATAVLEAVRAHGKDRVPRSGATQMQPRPVDSAAR